MVATNCYSNTLNVLKKFRVLLSRMTPPVTPSVPELVDADVPPPVVQPRVAPIVLRRVANPRAWYEIANMSLEELRRRERRWLKDPRTKNLPFPAVGSIS